MRGPLPILFTLSLALGACSGAPGDVPASSPVTSQSATSTSAVSSTPSTMAPPTSEAATTTTAAGVDEHRYELTPVDAERPTVEVMDPGAEPRRELEFDLDVGTSAQALYSLTLFTDQQINGEVAASSEFVVELLVSATVLSEAPDGWVIASTVESASVTSDNAEVERTLGEVYAFLPGTTTYVLMARDGAVLAEDNSALGSFGDASGQDLDLSIGALVPQFPSQPVGVGAVWTVSTQLEQEFVGIDQVATYTALVVDASGFELELSIQQELLNPEALTVGLTDAQASYVGTGEGTVRIDVGSPLQLGTTINTQRIEIRGTADDQEVEVITINRIVLEFAAAP